MKKYSGAQLDNRNDSEKEKDYSIKELGASSIKQIPYVTKRQALKKILDIRDQGATSSCGAHAGEVCASEIYDPKVEFSRAKIYRNRANYPGEGMYIYDIGNIMSKIGLELYTQIKTNEQTYNAISKDVANVFKIPAFTVDDTPTFDELAYTSNVLKLPQVVLLYSKNSKEYGDEIPEADPSYSDPYKAGIRHFVKIPADGAFKYKNKEYLIIQDSSGFGKRFIRFFSRDWVEKRILASSAYLQLDKKEKPKNTKYVFTKNLDVGNKNDEVVKLQTVLKEFGFFPSNIPSTGYFGGITRQAVKDFQKKYERSILWPLGLKLPTGFFGPSTRKVLNELIANQ